MIANSDQYIDADIDEYLALMEAQALDGLIMTMKADDPKWSFVGLDPQGLVTHVVEKQVISDEATVGLYNFRRGRDFVAAARDMVRADARVNGEFYVAPVYNGLVAAGARVGIHCIGREGAGMHGLGIPADLQAFLDLPLSRAAAGVCA
jgi:dTDP-glucose pyrophosphorylase